jgi:uncharacterized iron-regulated membrane protein
VLLRAASEARSCPNRQRKASSQPTHAPSAHAQKMPPMSRPSGPETDALRTPVAQELAAAAPTAGASPMPSARFGGGVAASAGGAGAAFTGCHRDHGTYAVAEGMAAVRLPQLPCFGLGLRGEAETDRKYDFVWCHATLEIKY